MTGCCEYGKESLGSVKDREFRDQMNDYYLLKKDSAPCLGSTILAYSSILLMYQYKECAQNFLR
jgi:hypothetical protein